MDKSKQNYRNDYIIYLARMSGAAAALPADEREKLELWETEHLDGRTVGTSDWPGWERYIGPKPTPPPLATAKPKEPIPIELRWLVWSRDNFTCLECGSRVYLTVDHVIAESTGGQTVESNLQTLCKRCNSRKGAR